MQHPHGECVFFSFYRKEATMVFYLALLGAVMGVAGFVRYTLSIFRVKTVLELRCFSKEATVFYSCIWVPFLCFLLGSNITFTWCCEYLTDPQIEQIRGSDPLFWNTCTFLFLLSLIGMTELIYHFCLDNSDLDRSFLNSNINPAKLGLPNYLVIPSDMEEPISDREIRLAYKKAKALVSQTKYASDKEMREVLVALAFTTELRRFDETGLIDVFDGFNSSLASFTNFKDVTKNIKSIKKALERMGAAIASAYTKKKDKEIASLRREITELKRKLLNSPP